VGHEGERIEKQIGFTYDSAKTPSNAAPDLSNLGHFGAQRLKALTAFVDYQNQVCFIVAPICNQGQIPARSRQKALPSLAIVNEFLVKEGIAMVDEKITDKAHQ
jgi:hypothetical protein